MPQILSYACVILSGTLGFLIQPLMGKTLIPFFGGAPASWIGSLLFFQTSLLLGYIWAFWLLTKPAKTQVVLTGSLCLLAIILFKSPEIVAQENPTILGVIWALSVACLPACISIFSTTLLISGWLNRQNQKIPYIVYAISNLGSLTGLLAYAFLFEPNLTITTNSQIWYALLIIFGTTLTYLGWCQLKIKQEQKDKQDNKGNNEDLPTPKEILSWILLSALPCSLMIAATYLLSGEFGSNPLTWVGPLGIYLLAFSISFTGKIKEKHLPTITIVSITCLCLWKLTNTTLQAMGPLMLTTLFGCCLLVLTKLYWGQPKNNGYRHFLLSIAVGGSLGGLFSTFLVPIIFQNPSEFYWFSLISVTIGLFYISKKRWHAIVIACAVGMTPSLVTKFKEHSQPFPIYKRDTLGSLKIALNGPILSISSQNTNHGNQDLRVPSMPTSYYSPHSPIGLYLKSQTEPLRVGVVGLSAGVLAAYAKKEDKYTFWDIDPKVPTVANDIFEFIKNSPGKVEIKLGDGRLSLENCDQDYDVIVIDAYSGDAIPPHLVTKEAMEIYKKRLKNKNGALFIHHSTRYSRYTPIMENTAKAAGMEGFTVITNPEKVDPLSNKTRYSVIGTTQDSKTHQLTLDPNIHSIDKYDPKANPQIWTDELNSALHTLEPHRILEKWLEF